MKFSTALVAAATLMGSAMAKDKRTFAVMQFNGKEICHTRADPIVSPGERSAHVHSIFGASNFGISATGESISQSTCTNAKVSADKSNYWFPRLYFRDEGAGTVEPVEIFYVNVYYFFDATDDDIKAFPLGMSMVSGNAKTRVAPSTGGKGCLDPKDGEISSAKWTCPRSNYDPPSWPAGSDGSMAGIGDPNNKGEGVGFPFQNCDGYASPLRADVHFPSCYNPEAGLTNFKENMAWPSSAGTQGGKLNCPPGYIHVPHIFLEVYWNTPQFQDRWTPGQSQPFVLSNGDVTGFSSHGDFLSGWDEDVLQTIIDGCDAGHAGMHSCPGVQHLANDQQCTCEGEIFTDEQIDGTMSKLPGDNPFAGWEYGTVGSPAPEPETPSPPPVESPAESPVESPAPSEDEDEAPEAPVQPVKGDEQADPVPAPAAPTETVEDAQPESPAPTTPAEVPAPKGKGKKKGGACVPKIETVWETTTITADGPAPTDAEDADASGGMASDYYKKKQRRHLHRHAARHQRFSHEH